MKKDLTIIIPAFNEAERIEPTLVRIDNYLAMSDERYEILVIDDGSSDNTADVVERCAATVANLRCIRYTDNRGKGHAVRLGMLAARGEICVMMDADGSVDPEQLHRIVEPIRNGETDIAIGSRYSDGAEVTRRQPFYRRWWSRAANRVVQRVLIEGVRDTQCGFKAFSAAAAEDLFRRAQIDGWAFDLEVLSLAKRMGYVIREIPVEWSDDPRSRINPIRDAVNVFREMLAIRINLHRGVYGRLLPEAHWRGQNSVDVQSGGDTGGATSESDTAASGAPAGTSIPAGRLAGLLVGRMARPTPLLGAGGQKRLSLSH